MLWLEDTLSLSTYVLLFHQAAVAASSCFHPCSADEFTMTSWCLSAGSAGKCHANSINKSSYWHKLFEWYSQLCWQHSIFAWSCVCTNPYKYIYPSSKPPKLICISLFFFFLFSPPSSKRAASPVNDKAYKRIQAVQSRW